VFYLPQAGSKNIFSEHMHHIFKNGHYQSSTYARKRRGKKKRRLKICFLRKFCVLQHWRSFSYWPWGGTATCILAG